MIYAIYIYMHMYILHIMNDISTRLFGIPGYFRPWDSHFFVFFFRFCQAFIQKAAGDGAGGSPHQFLEPWRFSFYQEK